MDMHWPVRGPRGSFWPLGKWVRRRSRRGIEQGLTRSAGADGLRHRIVHLEDDALGAVLAPLLLVLAIDDGEGVHDVGHGVARGRKAGLEPPQVFRGLTLGGAPFAVRLSPEVEVKEGGVQFATKQEAARLVPAEGRAGPAAVLRERL